MKVPKSILRLHPFPPAPLHGHPLGILLTHYTHSDTTLISIQRNKKLCKSNPTECKRQASLSFPRSILTHLLQDPGLSFQQPDNLAARLLADWLQGLFHPKGPGDPNRNLTQKAFKLWSPGGPSTTHLQNFLPTPPTGSRCREVATGDVCQDVFFHPKQRAV